MSGLTHLEKQKLERELGMSSGLVLSFSNRTFEEFFREVVRVNIYDTTYDFGSGSKANRMRAFWQNASDHQLLLLFEGLLEGWSEYSGVPLPDSARQILQQVIGKLSGTPVEVTHSQQERVSSIDPILSQKLGARLLEVTAALPQKRGFEFERFLKDLFDVFGTLCPRFLSPYG